MRSTQSQRELPKPSNRAYQCECPPRIPCRDTINQHIRLRSDDRRVDETEEEEAAYQATDRCVARFGVFPLRAAVSATPKLMGETNPCERADLLADPPYPIRHRLHTVDDRREEGIGDLHEHCQAGHDDGLDVCVGSCDFGWDASREGWGKGSGVFLDLSDHLLIYLDSISARKAGEGRRTFSGFISRLRSLCSMRLLIRSASTVLR